jgi:hypothetical protein
MSQRLADQMLSRAETNFEPNPGRRTRKEQPRIELLALFR